MLELHRPQDALAESLAEALICTFEARDQRHIDADANDHERAACINDFISRTALSKPENKARATMA